MQALKFSSREDAQLTVLWKKSVEKDAAGCSDSCRKTSGCHYFDYDPSIKTCKLHKKNISKGNRDTGGKCYQMLEVEGNTYFISTASLYDFSVSVACNLGNSFQSKSYLKGAFSHGCDM